MSAIRRVSVAVLSWNGRRHLETCLPALREQRDPGVEWEVLVLDNGSEDDTVDWVERHHPEVRLLRSDANLGFCAGNDRLVAAASGDAVAFLNNDTRPRPDWLAALVDALRAAPDDVAAVSGQIVDWEGERLDFARGVLTFDGHAFQDGYRFPLARAPIPQAGSELLFACGGNMLIRRGSFLAAGGFPSEFFAYLEDVDLGWRLWAGGERVVFAPDAVVHHRSMATSDLLGAHHRGFLFERNAFLVAARNYDEALWPRMMPAILLTLVHRTQTLLVQNNPAGEQLTFDPYAGLIANTRKPERAGEDPAPAVVLAPPPSPTLYQKWRGWGTRELARRGVRKLLRKLAPSLLEPGQPLDAHVPRLADGRSVAQLRAITHLLAHLDETTAARRALLARRRRSDAEIFARFPLHVVPTYPGDERLFASDAFASWLPDDLPIVRRRLDEVMAVGE